MILKMKEKINKIFKKKWILILLGILIFAFILRIWVFSLTSNQPVWWDEGDYLTVAKKIGMNLFPNFKLSDLSNPRRPLLLPLLWAGIFKIGLGETTIRFIQVIFSIFAVFLTYLIGKEMFNKKVGLIASFMMAVFWSHLFYTGRLLLEVPATALSWASIYFFWKGYVKNENPKYIWLFGLFLGLSVFARAASLIIIIPVIIFLLIKDKLNFIKNKNLWIAFLIFLLIFLPFFFWVGHNYGNPFKKFTGIGEGRFADFNFNTLIHGNTIEFIKFFPDYLQIPYFILFLFGLVCWLDIFLGLDLLFKEGGMKLRKKLFILLWIIIPLLFFGITTSKSYLEERYLMYIFPAVFIISAIGLIKIYSYIKKYNKQFALVLGIFILLIGAYYQVSTASNLINIKKDSYLQVKESALWMKENLKENEIFMTQSVPQSMYYSERECYGYGKEDIFKKQIKELKPKYIILSMFEQHPEWAYKYPELYKLKPIKVYSLDNKPILIIYKL